MTYRNQKYVGKKVRITRTGIYKNKIGEVKWVEPYWIGVELDGFQVGKKTLKFTSLDIELC